MSHSTRVRGLKYGREFTIVKVIPSHSTRVRGLKFDGYVDQTNAWGVALYTSAWIEIAVMRSVRKFITSHSTRVRGLKF